MEVEMQTLLLLNVVLVSPMQTSSEICTSSRLPDMRLQQPHFDSP